MDQKTEQTFSYDKSVPFFLKLFMFNKYSKSYK